MTLSSSLKTLELDSLQLVEIINVKTSYRRLQKTWHPDLHIGKSTLEIARVRAVAINNAYEIVTEHIENYGPIKNGAKKTNVSNENVSSTKPMHRWKNTVYTPGFPNETVFEIFVKSSNLLSTGYNPIGKKLFIKFHDNSVYEYFDVPITVFDNLLNAESHGKFAHREIYYKFKYRRCTEENKKYKGPSKGKEVKFYLT